MNGGALITIEGFGPGDEAELVWDQPKPTFTTLMFNFFPPSWADDELRVNLGDFDRFDQELAELLPLTISPAPKKLVRTIVGRLELLTPEQVSATYWPLMPTPTQALEEYRALHKRRWPRVRRQCHSPTSSCSSAALKNVCQTSLWPGCAPSPTLRQRWSSAPTLIGS